MEPDNRNQQYKSIRRILWGVLVANLIITIVKITLGIVTGALVIVADGFHSLVDSSSNLIGLTAISMAARPADKRYPYGYQRYETLGALAIGGLLLAVAWEIVQSVIDRIINGAQPEINWVTFGLMALTFPINLGIVIFETRAGKRLNSDILLADATHTRTDLYVTGSVIASLVGIWLGWSWLDLVVATGVVGLIIRASIGILRDAAGSLADVIGIEPEQVEKIALGVPGVRFVHHVRSRGSSDAVFVDLHVKVGPSMTTSQAHDVASEVERRLRSNVKNIADAIVHIEPSRFEESSDWERIWFGLRRIADGMGMGIHDFNVHVDLNGDYGIELDLEIAGEITLGEAHQLADDFEAQALKFWPQAARLTTHLEPKSSKILNPSGTGDETLQVAVADYLKSQPHKISVLGTQALVLNDSKSLTIKIGMPSNISLNISHLQVEEVKRKILSHFSEVSRVVVHVEPMPIDQVLQLE
jgi:cation diffusion facilitator family transporter